MALTNTISETNAGKGGLNLSAFTPHLSSIWDMTRDGRTVMRGSFASYVDADAVRISRYALGDQVSRECRWNEETQSYSRRLRVPGRRQQDHLRPALRPPGRHRPTARDCRQELKLPRMWEYTFGLEREVVPGLSLAGDLIYRRFTRPYELHGDQPDLERRRGRR